MVSVPTPLERVLWQIVYHSTLAVIPVSITLYSNHKHSRQSRWFLRGHTNTMWYRIGPILTHLLSPLALLGRFALWLLWSIIIIGRRHIACYYWSVAFYPAALSSTSCGPTSAQTAGTLFIIGGSINCGCWFRCWFGVWFGCWA